MRDPATFIGWDFDNVWEPPSAESGPPQLRSR
jgi:hypothetical protein